MNEKQHYSNDSYYEDVVHQLMLQPNAKKKIAAYIVQETNSIKKVWYWIVLLLTASFMLLLLNSCGQISPDEVIDDRLPDEYNYKPTYKP